LERVGGVGVQVERGGEEGDGVFQLLGEGQRKAKLAMSSSTSTMDFDPLSGSGKPSSWREVVTASAAAGLPATISSGSAGFACSCTSRAVVSRGTSSSLSCLRSPLSVMIDVQMVNHEARRQGHQAIIPQGSTPNASIHPLLLARLSEEHMVHDSVNESICT